jgi:hypothetical protein
LLAVADAELNQIEEELLTAVFHRCHITTLNWSPSRFRLFNSAMNAAWLIVAELLPDVPKFIARSPACPERPAPLELKVVPP